MLPPAHFAIGYVLYSGYARTRSRRPDEIAVVFAGLGSQLPDLVDKPLAWTGLVPGGRTVAHSFLVLIPVVLVALLLARRADRVDTAVAFGVSAVAHPIADAITFTLQGTLAGDVEEMSFLVWPLDVDGTAVAEALASSDLLAVAIARKPAWTATHLPAGDELTLVLRAGQFGITCVAVAVWVADGKPGRRGARVVATRVADRLASADG